MDTQMPGTPNAEQLALLQKKLRLEASARNGINWFYWIAGMSILNSFIYFVGGSLSFVIGLGATQFIDGFTVALAKEISANSRTLVHLVGFGLDLGIAGIFIAAGYLGRKRHRWAIIIGMILYALDALIFLLVNGWLAIAFHGLALWGLWRGLSAMNQLNALEQSMPVSIPTAIISPMTQPKWYKTEAMQVLAILVLFFLATAVIVATIGFILSR